MKTINLKDIYPYYFTEDKWIDVPDELAQIFTDFIKAEETYERTKRRYKATYSLDRGDGIVAVGQTHQKACIGFIGLGQVVDADFCQVFVDFGGVVVFFGDGFHDGAQGGFAPCFFLLLG